MRKINFIFQEVLKIFLIFLLSFIWIRYFVRRLWLTVLISAIITLTIYLILYFIKRKKKNKEGLKIKEKEEAENMFLSLACDNKRMDFFFKLASSKHSNVKKFSKYILISHEDGKKTLLFPKSADLCFRRFLFRKRLFLSLQPYSGSDLKLQVLFSLLSFLRTQI